MDRNAERLCNALKHLVALRKESVDRNIIGLVGLLMYNLSLSARRAWIEIFVTIIPSNFSNVALRKESVDRNFHAVQIVIVIVQSLSARRAWIEMLLPMYLLKFGMSLSARRAWIEISIDDLEPSSTRSRSPQGERG